MSDPSPRDGKADEELALEARAGSRRAFEELALRYQRRLFVYLRPRLGSDEDAEDMVQETFLKLYRNIGSYDPGHRFSTWLYTSAHRSAISSYRKKRAAGAKIDPALLPAERTASENGAEAAAGLWEMARALGGNRFRVLWLRYAEEMTIDEIAASLSKSRLAVRILLHRARTNLMTRCGQSPARIAAPAWPGAAGAVPAGPGKGERRCSAV